MDESLKQLWTFTIWFAGISATTTLAVLGWLIALNNRVAIKDNIHKDLEGIKLSLGEIKVALIGDYEKKGLLTKYHELEERVQELEEKT